MSSGVREMIADSALWWAAAVTARTVLAAWNHSHASRAYRRARAAWLGVTAVERVRLAAAVAASTGLWHMAGLWVLPAYVAPGLPLIWPITVVACAVVMLIVAEPLTAAWQESSSRRLLRGSDGAVKAGTRS